MIYPFFTNIKISDLAKMGIFLGLILLFSVPFIPILEYKTGIDIPDPTFILSFGLPFFMLVHYISIQIEQTPNNQKGGTN